MDIVKGIAVSGIVAIGLMGIYVGNDVLSASALSALAGMLIPVGVSSLAG